MSKPAVVADTSVLIHFMEGHPNAEQWIFGREVQFAIVSNSKEMEAFQPPFLSP